MITQKLVLGTANFGESYGIGKKSKLTPNEVDEILTWADGKVTELDTSLDYKDAHHLISRYSSKFKVTSKINLNLLSSPKEITTHIKRIEEELCKAKVEKILLRPHSTNSRFTLDSIDELEKLRTTGSIAELGLSIYETSELEYFVNSLQNPITFQVPLNLLNRTFYEYLHSRRTRYREFKFYVRSIFLQGLLLLNPEEVPESLKEANISIGLLKRELARIGISTVEATFAFIRQQNWVDGVILGVRSLEELKRNYEVFEARKYVDLNFLKNIPTVPMRILDPRRW